MTSEAVYISLGFVQGFFFPPFAVCFSLGDNEGYHLPCAFYQGTVLFSRLIKIMDGLRWLIMSETFLLSSSRKAFRHGMWIEVWSYNDSPSTIAFKTSDRKNGVLIPPNPDEWSASFRWVAWSVWPLGVDGFRTGRTTAIHWVHGSCSGVCEARCKCGWGKKKEISHGGRHDWGEKTWAYQTLQAMLSKKCMFWLIHHFWWQVAYGELLETCFLCPNSHSLKAGFENCISNRRGFFCYWKKFIKHKSMKYMCLA